MRVSATDEPAFFSMLGVIVEDNLGPKPVARPTGGTRKALGSGHRADDSDVEEGCDMEACDARGPRERRLARFSLVRILAACQAAVGIRFGFTRHL